MLSVEDWAEIVRLHRAEGMPIKVIARTLGVSRNTVRAAVASDRPPKYVRRATGSVADAFEPRICELLRVYPTMPTTTIGERISWPYSIRWASHQPLSGKVGPPASCSIALLKRTLSHPRST